MVYKTALLFHENKKIANIAALLYTICFSPYLTNAMGIDQDLAVNPFLFITTIFFYKKFENNEIKRAIFVAILSSILTSSR